MYSLDYNVSIDEIKRNAKFGKGKKSEVIRKFLKSGKEIARIKGLPNNIPAKNQQIMFSEVIKKEFSGKVKVTKRGDSLFLLAIKKSASTAIDTDGVPQ